ncbi:4-alpha-glucanotransferase [uncultured Thiothrix sp.]|uniref:4-alpha-glucanotransferase n=1 Tax=uncultured Thiothrix sp. TaxID=223185 RepID=UPI00261A3CAC|nr:4-alpha-glucanotransferase [uncultured Thiothrix sp.]
MTTAILPNRLEAGILLHPSSLPSGQLDRDAWRWLDQLAELGVSVWQMLPLGLPLNGLSPYQCVSAFALNPALFPKDSNEPLEQLGESAEFAAWYQKNQHWADDFALFMELKAAFNSSEWSTWPSDYRKRSPEPLASFKNEHTDALNLHIYEQFYCWQHWQSLRADANELGIRLFGDMPIFVAYDSADVWAHPELFLLDAEGQPTVVTGVPPDYFSTTGQRWGNPHYNWELMQETQFAWWRERLGYHFDFFDLVRIDHFRGLEAAWTIPATSPTAIEGYWAKVPGDELLACLQAASGDLPLVAEDLGIITYEVTALRQKYQLPGMSVLQFAFDHFEDNPHKPWNVANNTVYYTGTHDNDTLLGWFNSLNPEQQAWALNLIQEHIFLSIEQNQGNIIDLMLATVFQSAAGLVMLPWQDVLGLGSEARMNVPGTIEGNWHWRFDWHQIQPDRLTRLKTQLQQHQRYHTTVANQ